MTKQITPDHSAASSALGYLYQVVYALVLLLRHGRDQPGIAVSIEKLDDVAFEEGGSAIKALQLKHHVKETASLSNRSTDLWKTLKVWADEIAAGRLNPNSQIQVLVTTAIAPKDSAADLLRTGEKRNPSKAKELLLDAAETSNAEKKSDIKKGLKSLKSLGEPKCTNLFKSIHILTAAPNIDEVLDLLRGELRLSSRPENLEAICERVQGWWCERAIEHMLKPSKIPAITFEEAHQKISDIQDGMKRDNLPVDFPNEVEISESQLNPEERIFVAQLRLIMLGDGSVKSAISDFYRAFNQRTSWVKNKLIANNELENYETRLESEWRQYFEIMEADAQGANDAQQNSEGRRLYKSIVLERHLPIRSEFVATYFMRGSYQILANDLRVGWHPDFYNRLITAYETAKKSVA